MGLSPLRVTKMIRETRTYQCTRYGSTNIVKNGRTRYGSQKFHCKDCKAYRVLQPKVRYTQEQKELILSDGTTLFVRD